MWSTPAVWKQYNKMAVLHFFLVNSPLYIYSILFGWHRSAPGKSMALVLGLQCGFLHWKVSSEKFSKIYLIFNRKLKVLKRCVKGLVFESLIVYYLNEESPKFVLTIPFIDWYFLREFRIKFKNISNCLNCLKITKAWN